MIEEHLKALGFGDKEAAVYLAVLGRGKTTPARVATDTSINRATVYATAKTLIEKGVLSEDLAGPTKYLVAEPIEAIVRMVEREKQELNKRLEVAKQVQSELLELGGAKQFSIPKIKFIEERNIEEYLYKQSPIWTADILRNKTYYYGFQDHTFVEHYKEWIDWYWTHMDERAELRLLTNESDVEKRMEGRHERRVIKFWPQNKSSDKAKETFDSTIWIMGDYIAMIVTREKPRYLVEIHDAVMARNLRQLFEGIWQG